MSTSQRHRVNPWSDALLQQTNAALRCSRGDFVRERGAAGQDSGSDHMPKQADDATICCNI